MPGMGRCTKIVATLGPASASPAQVDALLAVRAVTGPESPLLVAKIETPSAVEALPALLQRADAVMVARGDLGISCPLEDGVW